MSDTVESLRALARVLLAATECGAVVLWTVRRNDGSFRVRLVPSDGIMDARDASKMQTIYVEQNGTTEAYGELANKVASK